MYLYLSIIIYSMFLFDPRLSFYQPVPGLPSPRRVSTLVAKATCRAWFRRVNEVPCWLMIRSSFHRVFTCFNHQSICGYRWIMVDIIDK